VAWRHDPDGPQLDKERQAPAALEAWQGPSPKRWLADDVAQWIRELTGPGKIKPRRFVAQDQGEAT
jgi:hypothetical protein